MNDQTAKLLEQLAAKLGTTAEYLWMVLIKRLDNSNSETLQYPVADESWSAIEYLDESEPLAPADIVAEAEAEAELLYPDENDGPIEGAIRAGKRAAHISCAQSYEQKVKGLEGEVAELRVAHKKNLTIIENCNGDYWQALHEITELSYDTLMKTVPRK